VASNSKPIKVSFDGGVTWIEAAQVMVETPSTQESEVTVILTITAEGQNQDIWSKEGDEELLHTSFVLWDDLLPSEFQL